MRRVILAGVGLTLTACGFSATPPSQPTASKPQAQPDSYVSALTDTGQCTLWREVAGQPQCLDGAQAPAQASTSAAAGPLKAPPPAAAPRIAVTSQPLDAPAAAALAPAAGTTAAAHPADAALAGIKPAGPNLFEEMRKLGMIKQGAGDAAAPGFVANAPATASTLAPAAPSAAPSLPSLPAAGQPMLAAKVAPVSNVSAFADTAPKAGPVPARPAAPAVSSVVTQSWAPVEPPRPAPAEPRVQLAASTPGVAELMGRAPVSPVERAELPAVRSTTVVPLKIAQKATEETPAVVVPAVASQPAAAPVANRQLAQATAPALPSLPALPPLPGASGTAVSSAPAASPPATSAPALPVAAQPDVSKADVSKPVVSKPATLAAPALPSAPPPAVSAPAPSVAPVKAAAAKPAPAQAVPAKAAAKPAAGRYLVLHSFQERARADRLVERYRAMDARVASVKIKGQTWHRVVVRDDRSARRQLASEGVRGFWPTSL